MGNIYKIIINIAVCLFLLFNYALAMETDFEIQVYPPSECNDGQDNDGDGLIDYPNDPECAGLTDNYESHQQCSDNYDNDGDGLIDYPSDPGCSANSDEDETDVYQCNDGQDNDGDGLIDYPSDPGCANNSDDDETNTSDNSGSSGSQSSVGPGLTIINSTSVSFSGWAYPLSEVTVLQDGQIAVSTIAGPDAKFFVSLNNLNSGNYNFSLYTKDKSDRRSNLFSFPVYITSGASTQVSGIFLAPTIDLDKKQVKKGDVITILGQSVPNVDIVITVNSETEDFVYTKASSDGFYLYKYDTSFLETGDHTARSKSQLSTEISNLSQWMNFVVGDQNVLKEISEQADDFNKDVDLNNDSQINIVDFSILAYWYKRHNIPSGVDLNSDGRIDLIDFSILAFYWTG